jgi:two-component system CheB/CheR fusion protein
VTEFFRDPEIFEPLERQILPQLFDHKAIDGERVRAWTIGCSTGEEAYSLAMLMLEQASKRETSLQLQVFASDLSDDVLKRARRGIFPNEIAATVSVPRLARFFVRELGHYRVRQDERHHRLRRTTCSGPPTRISSDRMSQLLRDLQPTVRRGIQSLLLRPAAARRASRRPGG